MRKARRATEDSAPANPAGERETSDVEFDLLGQQLCDIHRRLVPAALQLGLRGLLARRGRFALQEERPDLLARELRHEQMALLVCTDPDIDANIDLRDSRRCRAPILELRIRVAHGAQEQSHIPRRRESERAAAVLRLRGIRRLKLGDIADIFECQLDRERRGKRRGWVEAPYRRVETHKRLAPLHEPVVTLERPDLDCHLHCGYVGVVNTGLTPLLQGLRRVGEQRCHRVVEAGENQIRVTDPRPNNEKPVLVTTYRDVLGGHEAAERGSPDRREGRVARGCAHLRPTAA